MSGFTYKEVYVEDNRKVLELNILPEKHCNFDCIFCPIGRSKSKDEDPMSFEYGVEAMNELAMKIDQIEPDLIFINSMGEAFVNENVEDVIDFIKSKGVAIKLLTNGYLLGREAYIRIANKCDEVLGEIKVITEEGFQKVQRPIEGYTLKQYIENMASFKKQFSGHFILEVTLIKGMNDDEASTERLKEIIREIAPDQVVTARIDDAIFVKKLGVSDETFNEISEKILEI